MCFRKIPVAKKLKEKWGEYQDFPSKSFCLIVPKNFIGEPFCAVFRKFLVAKKFMDKRGGEGYQELPSIIFCLTVPKICVGEPLFVSQNFWYRKISWRRGGEPRFPVESFLSHSAEKFIKGTRLCFTTFPLSKNVRDKRGCHSRFSVENFFVSQCRKIS